MPPGSVDAHHTGLVNVEPDNAGERRPLNVVAHGLLLGFLYVDRLNPQVVAPRKKCAAGRKHHDAEPPRE